MLLHRFILESIKESEGGEITSGGFINNSCIGKKFTVIKGKNLYTEQHINNARRKHKYWMLSFILINARTQTGYIKLKLLMKA